MERMLRPQGLFQHPQPKQYDWNNQWTPGSAPAAGSPAPAAGSAPAGPVPPGGGATWPGQAPTPPPGVPTTPTTGQYPAAGGNPFQPADGGAYPVNGQYLPDGPYQTGALAQAGGPVPPGAAAMPGQGQYQPGFDGPGQHGPAGQFGVGAGQPGQGQFPPDPYGSWPNGPGQYGQAQNAQAPYPAGQYAGQFGQGQVAPGQYGADQYGADQYGQGQYPDGQYGPGADPGGHFGLPGPYGPGGQFGPGGSPAAGRKRPLTFGKITLPRSPLVPAIVVVALVAVVATAVALSASGPTSASGNSTAPGSATTPKATSSAAGQSLTERQAARQLSGLLAQSGTDHADVTDAVLNVEACGKNLGADARVFSRSAANRNTLLAKLAALPGRSSLPGAMITDLTGAWQASAAVDTDLAKWASHAATAGCHGGDMKYSSYIASVNDDTPATNDKLAFVSLWNPLAKKDSLPTYKAAQL
jgi:hypothetical protein